MANVFKDRYEELCDKLHNFEMEGNPFPEKAEAAWLQSEVLAQEGKYQVAFFYLSRYVSHFIPHLSI